MRMSFGLGFSLDCSNGAEMKKGDCQKGVRLSYHHVADFVSGYARVVLAHARVHLFIF